MRRSQLAWAFSFLTLIAVLAVMHLTAPAVVPMRYGVDGNVVAWASRDGWFLWAYGFVFLMNAIFGICSTRYTFKVIPLRMWNIPHKEFWLAPGRREAGLDRIGDLMAWGGLVTNLTMGAVYLLVACQSAGLITGNVVNLVIVFIVIASFLTLPAAARFMKPPSMRSAS